MFGKIRGILSSWFGGPEGGDGEGVRYELAKLYQELQETILHNQVRLAENEGLIARVEATSLEEEQKVREASTTGAVEFHKRAALRRVRSCRKRIESLSNCSSIYRDNIAMQTALSERLEDMRVSGLKTVSAETLEEMALDYEEMYNKHRDLVDSVKAMDIEYEAPESFEDDPELRDLAREHGLI